ncbi:MAG: ChaN family lipoprotein [Planctomycetota bacterium]|nr:ChaN family lipoprotein [Planctomycetota bacterium]
MATLQGCVSPSAVRPVAVNPTQSHVWRGDGTPASWQEMLADLRGADAVFLGEEHDDGAGHALQRQIVDELFVSWGGGVLSLEMLERDEQPDVDAWIVRDLSTADFMASTGSTSWAGEGSWVAWYQPILNAAVRRGGTVVAANCPREFVRQALADGYEGLPAWDDPVRAQFDVPAWDHPEYREDLRELMVRSREELAEGAKEPEDAPAAEEVEDAEEVLVTEEELDRALRAQLVWDATMSRSAAAARSKGRVVHLAGHFHIDHAGGTVAEYRRLRPSDIVRTVTVRQESGFAPGDDEQGAADWIIGSASARR